MADLISLADVEERLGRALTEPEARRTVKLIADSSANIRRVAGGQQFTLETSTVRLRPRGGRIRLPQAAVTDVVSVKNTDAVDLDFTWDGLTLTLGIAYADPFEWNVRPYTDPVVDVEYEHGYATVPEDIVGVACQLVIRALVTEPADAGLTSETIAGYSYTRGSVGAAGPFGMFDDERALVEGYRQPALPILMM